MSVKSNECVGLKILRPASFVSIFLVLGDQLGERDRPKLPTSILSSDPTTGDLTREFMHTRTTGTTTYDDLAFSSLIFSYLVALFNLFRSSEVDRF